MLYNLSAGCYGQNMAISVHRVSLAAQILGVAFGCDPGSIVCFPPLFPPLSFS